MLRSLAALALLTAATALGACGSSKKPATAASTGAAATAPSSTAKPSAAGCRQLPAPAAKGPQHLAKPALRLDPAKPTVARLLTSCGEIDIALDVRAAPKTTASFVYLVRRGFFDGLTFHRVASAPDGTPFVIQGGDPLGTGAGGPGYTVVEPPAPGTRYDHGTVAMAKTQADPRGASGSQFFIVSGASAPLPPDYALLGHVSAGDAVVSHIAALRTDAAERPRSPVVIARALIVSGR